MGNDASPTAGGTPGSAGTAGQGGTNPEPQPSTTGTGGTPADGGTPSTPEDVSGLKSALEAERNERKREADARKQAETELNDLKAASLSDQEKATKEAVKQAEDNVRSEAKTAFRSLRVEASLIGAGMKPGVARDLATSSRFASVEVKDDYTVDQSKLDAAIGELKTAEPSFFAGAAPSGQPSRGPQHAAARTDQVKPGSDRLRAAYADSSKR